MYFYRHGRFLKDIQLATDSVLVLLSCVGIYYFWRWMCLVISNA